MNNITWKEAIFYVKWKVLSKIRSGLHYETHTAPNVISLPKAGSEQCFWDNKSPSPLTDSLNHVLINVLKSYTFWDCGDFHKTLKSYEIFLSAGSIVIHTYFCVLECYLGEIDESYFKFK